MKELKEGIDYYFNESGLMVFTKHFLLERGYCCSMGCKHCPYDEKKLTDLKNKHSNLDSSEKKDKGQR